MDDKEPFLARWSRRKLETKADLPASAEPAVEPRPGAEPLAAPGAAPAPGQPKPSTPEYRQFFDPQVDEKLRRTALKKLFSEPQFNVMDGLDTYIDDYSKPDPIPEAMLRQLNQAKDLFLFDDEKQAGEGASGAAPVASADTAPAADAPTLPEPPPADTPGAAAGIATDTAPAAPAQAVKNA